MGELITVVFKGENRGQRHSKGYECPKTKAHARCISNLGQKMVEHIQNLGLTSLETSQALRELERYMVLLSISIQNKMRRDNEKDTL